MAVEKGSAFQESQLPRLKGLQGEATGTVNLFRGSITLPMPVVSLPGRNGLIFKCSAFYQSDQADSQYETWSLERPTSILGTGWSMPYERIFVDQKQNGTIEDNEYYYSINGQPAKLNPLSTGWERGRLTNLYAPELVEGQISATLKQGLIDAQILVSSTATLTSLNAPTNTIWELSDDDLETLYTLTVQEDGQIFVRTGGISFELFEYQYWHISYYPAYERWEIVHNDGGRYSFGGNGDEIDPGTPSNTKQYAVKWGNWSGPSNQVPGQEQYVKAWNLAKVENALGNYYHVNYSVVEQEVAGGSGAKTYTKECYVRKVKNDIDWSVEYDYQNKTYDSTELYSPKEYMDPHKNPAVTPDTSPNAYQSSYETKYLWRIYVRNASNEVETWTEFDYYNLWNAQEEPASWAGKSDQEKIAYGATYQRYLKSITQYTGESLGYPTQMGDRYSKPGVLFDYYFTKDSNEPRGRLKTVVHPGGGKTTYTYDLVKAGDLTKGEEVYPIGSRSLNIENPFEANKNGNVRTWGGSDYIVCCWYDNSVNQVLMNVYTWMGRWVRSFSDWITFNQPVNFDSVNVVVSQNSFALVLPTPVSLSKTDVYLYYRDPLQKGFWRYQNGITPNTYQTSNLEIQNGEDFYIILDNDNKVMERVTWDPINKRWLGYSIPTNANLKYYLAAADNYYVTLGYDKNNEIGTFKIAYRGLDQGWHYGTDLENVSMSIPGYGSFSYCVMQPGESFVALSIVTGYTPDGQGSFKAFDYEARVISWDTDYVLSEPSINNIENGTFNNLPSYILNTPTNIVPIVIENSSVGSGPNLIRYDGLNWDCMTVGLVDKGFTDPNHQYYWYAYGQHALLGTENTDSGVESKLLTVDPSNPSSNGVVSLEDSPPSINRYLLGYPTLRGGYITKGGTTYQQVLTTDWLNIINNVLIEIDSLLEDGEQVDYTTLINEAPDFMAFLILDSNGNPKETGYLLFQNGDVVRDDMGTPILKRFAGEQIFRPLTASHVYKNAGSGRSSGFFDSFMTFPSTSNSLSQTPSINIHRYSAQELSGVIEGFVIQSIETDTGYDKLSKCYGYSDVSAAADAFKGEILRFQEVNEYNGCKTPGAQQHGHITSHFYNGIPSLNTTYTSETDLYNLLDGQLVEKKVYDYTGTLQSSEALTWVVQTQIAVDPESTQIRNIYGGIPQVVETTTMHMGITNTKTVSYNLSSGHPNETLSQYYDSQGRLILNRSTVTYAYEIPDYRGLWQKNVLTPSCQHKKYVRPASEGLWTLSSAKVQTYKLWDIVGQEIEHWGPEKGFIAINDHPDTFSWWTGPTEPVESNGWQKTGTTLAVNEQGQVIESEDALGRHNVTIFDDNETYPLAHFGNATFEDGVLYTSFEAYQTNVWTLLSGSIGNITTEDSFIGNQCYQLDPNGVASSSIGHVINNFNKFDQIYCLSFWYKTSNSSTEVMVEIGGGGTLTPISVDLEGTNGEWKPYQLVVDFNDFGVTGPGDLGILIQLKGGATSYLRVDQILFGPRDCRMGAQTFDSNKLRTLGGVSVNEASQKTFYNMWNVGFTEIGSYNQTTHLSTGYSVRQDPGYNPLIDPFPTDNPNVSIHFKGQEKGFYDEYKSQESLNNYTAFLGSLSDWTVQDKTLKLIGGGAGDKIITHSLDINDSNDITTYVEVVPTFAPGENNPSQVMYFGTKEFLVEWDGGNSEWKLLKWNSGTGSYDPIPGETSTTPWQPSWHFTIIEDRLMFTANGILIFNYQDSSVSSVSNREIAFGGQVSTEFGFKNLVVLDDIQMGLGYHDGSGRLLQGLTVEDSDTVILTPTVYDELGRDSIKVLPSRVAAGDIGVTDPFAYYPNFIANGENGSGLWLGDPMTGPVAEIYHPDSLVDPQDPSKGGYPFSRTVYEKSPHGRPIMTGKPGKEFAISRQGGLLNSHVTSINYGINDGTEEFLYALPEAQYFKTTVTDPDGNKGIQYHTQAGHSVGSIAQPAGSSLGHSITSSQVYDMFGQVIASIPPNYYEGNTNPQTGIIPVDSPTYVYDFLGHAVEVNYPDSGTTKVVYDKVGRVRFTQDQKGALSNPEYFYYNKYDKLGRAIEQGGYAGDWKTEATKANANDETWPTTGNINIIQTESYDGEAVDPLTGVIATPNMVGRPWKTTHYNEGADTAEITNVAAYTPVGQMEKMTQEMVFNGGSPQSASRSYTYGINGRLLSQTEDISNLNTEYDYNRLGQTIETRVTDPSQSTPNNVIKAEYDYTQLGQLNSVKPYKKDNSLLTTKDYAYLPNGWLKDTKDGFIDQDLKYTEGNCETPSEGYYNGALANNKVTYSGSGITPPTSDYCYTADYLKRVVKANNAGGNQYDWEFDDNSNILKYTTGTDDHNYEIELNKNQLKKILSSTTSFERNFVYDENGDTRSVKENTNLLLDIVYNTTNRKAHLIYNAVNNREATFDYGPSQNRIRKQVTNNGVPAFTSTFPIPGVEVIDDGTTTQTKTYLGTQGMGLVYHKEDQKFHWILPDNLGSTRMIVDEDGTPEWVFNYDVYGSPTATSYNNPTMTFNNLFTGQYWDEELGLYNYHARFYDPTLARFLQVDPAHQGFSPYTYVGGMPNIATDPTGKITVAAGLFIAGLFTAAIGGIITLFGAAFGNNSMSLFGEGLSSAGVGIMIASAGVALMGIGFATIGESLVGGGIGFAIGGLTTGITSAISVAGKKNVNFGKLSASLWANAAISGVAVALGSLATEALGAATYGSLAGIGGGLIAGAAGGASATAATQEIVDGRIDDASVGWSALIGGIAGGVFGGLSKIQESLVNVRFNEFAENVGRGGGEPEVFTMTSNPMFASAGDDADATEGGIVKRTTDPQLEARQRIALSSFLLGGDLDDYNAVMSADMPVIDTGTGAEGFEAFEEGNVSLPRIRNEFRDGEGIPRPRWMTDELIANRRVMREGVIGKINIPSSYFPYTKFFQVPTFIGLEIFANVIANNNLNSN